MDWRKVAIEELRMYEWQKRSLENMNEKIKALEYQSTAIKSYTTDSTPVQGGGNRMQQALDDIIVERDYLELTREATKIKVRLVENALKCLDKREQRVLELFYMRRPSRHIDQLTEEFEIEKTRVYEMKDQALRKYTAIMHGLQEY